MCGPQFGGRWSSEDVPVKGLGDNHRFKEGPQSELTYLIEPLGKNKNEAIGRDGVRTAEGSSNWSAALGMEPALHANDSLDRLWHQSALINGSNQGCSGDHLCPVQVRTIRPTLEHRDRCGCHFSHSVMRIIRALKWHIYRLSRSRGVWHSRLFWTAEGKTSDR